MRHSKSSLALVALIALSVSMPVIARGNGQGGGGRGAGPSGGHARSHARGSAFVPHRHFYGRPRIGLFLGAPVFAAPYFYPPGYFSPAPPVEYIEQGLPPDRWYFCPETNGYYPYVQQCPGGWEQVMPPSPAAAWQPAAAWDPSAGAWEPSPAGY